MYYIIAFIMFFYLGYKVRGLVEIYKIVRMKNYFKYYLDSIESKKFIGSDKE